MKSNNPASGNIFLAIFAAIAVTGIVGAAVMTFSKGPVQNALGIAQLNSSQVEMSMAGQLAIMSATNQANKGDCDSDGYVEPPEWRVPTAPSTAPTNGGLIPNSVGSAKRDPWGSEYGYCVWDDGPVIQNAACQTTGGVNKRLEGYNSKKYPVIAIISAGPDKVFTTTCRNFRQGLGMPMSIMTAIWKTPSIFPLSAKPRRRMTILFLPIPTRMRWRPRAVCGI